MSRGKLLRWAALPVTDRRWAAPLSAIALGFGLFVGVAISPGTAGTLAGGAMPLLLEVPPMIAEHGAPGAGGRGGSGLAAESRTAPAAPMPASISSEPALPGDPEPTTATPVADPGEEPVASTPGGKQGEQEDERELTGTVIHVNPAAGSYTLAESGGALDVIHSGKPPRPGTEVSLPVRPLANGTLAEAGRRHREGQTTRAVAMGVVTHQSMDPEDPSYTLSARGVSVVVHVKEDDPDSAPTLHEVGVLMRVEVKIEAPIAPPLAPTVPPAPEAGTAPTCVPDAESAAVPPSPAPLATLRQLEAEPQGDPLDYADLAAVVVAVCPESSLVSLSVDDLDSLRERVDLTIPAGFDSAGLVPGQSVAATVNLAPDGSFELAGVASDERLHGADDDGSGQGDLATRP